MFYILVDAAEEVGILFFCRPPAANISLLLQAVYAVFVIKKKKVCSHRMQRKKDWTPSAAPTSHPQQATGDSSSVNADMFDSSMHGL